MNRSAKRKGVWFAVIFTAIVLAGFTIWSWRNGSYDTSWDQSLPPLQSTQNISDRYDVIVAGTEPEGVASAVSAARNGLKVLLLDGKNRDRLGGLITLGWLNSLDLNFAPVKKDIFGRHIFLNKGIFQEWYDQLEGTSIDVSHAAAAYQRLVQEENGIDLLIKVRSMKPVMHEQKVIGINVIDEFGIEREILAEAVIDATQDADIAALAGAPFTVGREDLGNPEARMAVTLVFKLSGVTQDIWKSFSKRKDTETDKMSAWGFSEAKLYQSTNPERIALRGLNIGRQNDDTILVNAMHIFDIDPLDPASVKEGYEIGSKEAQRIVRFLKSRFSELSKLQYGGVAPELYIRESRHLQGEYRLTIADVMENKDFWDAIAYGSYEVDIQRLSPHDYGAIMMTPMQYGVPFRTLVPLKVDGLLVVGRSASFDSLPHGSARVIPLGMATGEAAGAAVKLIISKEMSFRELSKSKGDIEALRQQLIKQGMDLTRHEFAQPAYQKHKAYKGLLAAVSMNMIVGGYSNTEWDLDGATHVRRYRNMMKRLNFMHPGVFIGNPELALPIDNDNDGKLSLELAAYGLCYMTGVVVTPDKAVDELLKRGWVDRANVSGIVDQGALTNGEAFMLVRDAAEYIAGAVYQ